MMAHIWNNGIAGLFTLAMKRPVPPLFIPDSHELVLNLGCGNSPIPDTMGLDRPGWNAETDPLPYRDGEVDGVMAFHFLEHLTDPRAMLWEIQRVLRPGGVLTIGVPYYRCAMAHHDLDHKAWFTEDTWRNLMDNPYYHTEHGSEWTLQVRFNMVMFLVERNQILLTQMIKEES